MILSVHQMDANQFYDVCIVGSGPAGMTLAVALHREGKRVLVLEAGGREFSTQSQDVYEGRVLGEEYQGLQATRLRYLGGTSNHWGGNCRPLDEIDFKRLDAFPETEWPISRSDLDPYGAMARDILALDGNFEDKALSDGVVEADFKVSDPVVRFGEKYIDLFDGARDLSICLEANLTRLDTSDGRITAAHFRDFDGNSGQARASVFVLACGGVENSRLLLHFNDISEGNIVRQAETLGRYWMEHPQIGFAGDLVMFEFFENKKNYTLDKRTQQDLNILNCRLRMLPEPLERDGRVQQLVADLACRAPAIASTLRNWLGRDLVCGAALPAVVEMAPRPENRIALSETDRDFFDIPSPILHLEYGPEVYETVRQTMLKVGEHLARTDQGRIRIVDWLANNEKPPEGTIWGGSHHMGGTRMSRQSGDGIVDPDLKVWGQDNLYIAGSSVFPSGGYANPTYTIVQLSLRLADHIKQRL